MKSVIVKKENGEVSIVDNGIENIKHLMNHCTNPCCDCEYGYANKCPKVADEVKKDISEYDFITDGFQDYDDNGEIEKFLITKCINYKKQSARQKPKTREEIEALKRLKESIKILYYGGYDINEANKTQADINRRAFMKRMKEEAKKNK